MFFLTWKIYTSHIPSKSSLIFPESTSLMFEISADTSQRLHIYTGNLIKSSVPTLEGSKTALA